jgi:hypothetical protein
MRHTARRDQGRLGEQKIAWPEFRSGISFAGAAVMVTRDDAMNRP